MRRSDRLNTKAMELSGSTVTSSGCTTTAMLARSASVIAS